MRDDRALCFSKTYQRGFICVKQAAQVKMLGIKAYPILKKYNPYVPILIREAMGITPMLWVRYEYGREENLSLDGLSEKECEKRVNSFLFNA
ncbi:hypothetical protein PCANB_001814 [Pneumocystis canis]|nr:hypothetical protein PCANB_001814 [Pneumocystis canis]